MLGFNLVPKQGDSQKTSFHVAELIVAGWTGRDEAALRHHIEELAAIGVPRPSSVPVFYRNAVSNIVQTDRLGSHRPQGRDDGHRALEAVMRQGDGTGPVALRRDQRALGSNRHSFVRE